MRAVGCGRMFTSLARALPSVAFALISPSASSQWQPALSRLSEHTLRVCIPAGVSQPDERYPSSNAAASRGFRRHITSNQAFIISSAATPAPRSYRLLTTGSVSTVSPASERLKKKMKIKKKKKKKNPTQGHLRGIHPPPLELVTEPPPIPDPPPLRMRKCVLATLSDTCCCCCCYIAPVNKAISVLLCFS